MTIRRELRVLLPAVKYKESERCAWLAKAAKEMAVKHSESKPWTRVPECFTQAV